MDMLILIMETYGGFLSHGSSPSYHPFLDGIFPHKPSIWGYPHLWKPPYHDDDDGHRFFFNLHRTEVLDILLIQWDSVYIHLPVLNWATVKVATPRVQLDLG